MQIDHFILTRFSYRGAFKEVRGPNSPIANDPLQADRLEIRFKLFEMTCLPSILGQTEQNFAWVIIVDRDLPTVYRERLESLTRRKPRTSIHSFDPASSLATLDWLRPYSVGGAEYVMTTNLDDDDALPSGYLATIRRRLDDAEVRGRLPPIAIAGARQIVQWELLTSNQAPLGWKAPWHRAARGGTVTTTASAGFSLLCKTPEFNLCVYELRHAAADTYLDFSKPAVHGNAIWFRSAIAHAAAASNVDLRKWRYEELFHDVSRDLGPVLMTNHAWNDQAQRVFEAKPGRTVVTGLNDFPDLLIDWEKARAYADCFREPDSGRGRFAENP